MPSSPKGRKANRAFHGDSIRVESNEFLLKIRDGLREKPGNSFGCVDTAAGATSYCTSGRIYLFPAICLLSATFSRPFYNVSC